MWVIEIQFILQILVNRVSLITRKDSKVEYIRWGTAAIITLVNISVFCIWIPAHLNVSQTYININNIWDKITKFIILFVDVGLNFYFIAQVKQRLVRNGIEKYNDLVHFNTRIVIVSISMDLLIVGTMFLKKGVVFLQFHPVAYIVKLKIELSMTNLITKIAQETVTSRSNALSSSKTRVTISSDIKHKRLARTAKSQNDSTDGTDDIGLQTRVGSNPNTGISTTVHGDVERGLRVEGGGDMSIYTTREVKMSVSHAGVRDPERASTQESGEFDGGFEEDDQKPLAW